MSKLFLEIDIEMFELSSEEFSEHAKDKIKQAAIKAISKTWKMKQKFTGETHLVKITCKEVEPQMTEIPREQRICGFCLFTSTDCDMHPCNTCDITTRCNFQKAPPKNLTNG